MPTLTTDLIGRVKRLPLKPSATSALLPMFEAVSNGIHAIDDLWGDKAREGGRVEVEVLREEVGKPTSKVTGFVIYDNGIGLNEENWESFKRPDSQHKLTRGGKGVGRLGWLKVFSDIRVDSNYKDAAGWPANRTFEFKLTNDEQIVLLPSPKATSATPGTRVSLKGFEPAYGGKCPVSPETIRQRLLGHFMVLLAAKIAPAIVVIDCDETVDLRDAFEGFVKDSVEAEVEVALEGEDPIKLTIRHVRADKAIRFDANRKAYNWLMLAANQRAVEDAAIDEAIGLKLLEGDEVYVGCVAGEHLDAHVNGERTAFSFDGNEGKEIRRALLNSVMSYLDEHVAKVKERKRKMVRAVVEEYPQFLYLHSEMQSFVEKLAPGATSKEAVFVEMCRDRFRKHNVANKLEASVMKAPAFTAEVKAQMDRYTAFAQEQQQGVLAEYVLLRKSVIDILDHFSGFQDGTDKNFLEEAIHKLVIPMRTDSAALGFEDHNLWLVDDRLAFYSHFASDRPFKSFTDQTSKDRPDIALFYDTCFAWREQDVTNTIVLVEFKRPGRDNYTDADNPLRQLVGYIRKFQNTTSLRDTRGNTLSPKLKNAAFHCYIVADLTDSLRACFDGYPFHETPDGEGLVGYLRSPDAFVEVISYSKLLTDAKMRNAVFFKRLGLTDIAPQAPAVDGDVEDMEAEEELEQVEELEDAPAPGN